VALEGLGSPQLQRETVFSQDRRSALYMRTETPSVRPASARRDFAWFVVSIAEQFGALSQTF